MAREREDETEATRQLARGLADADRASKALKKALADAAKAAEEETRERERAIGALKQTVAGIAGAGVSALGQRGAGLTDLSQGVYEGFSQALPDLLSGIGSLFLGKPGEALGRAAGNLGRAGLNQGETQQEFDARKLAIQDTAGFTKARAESGVPVSTEQQAAIFAAFFAREMRALENDRQARVASQFLPTGLR